MPTSMEEHMRPLYEDLREARSGPSSASGEGPEEGARRVPSQLLLAAKRALGAVLLGALQRDDTDALAGLVDAYTELSWMALDRGASMAEADPLAGPAEDSAGWMMAGPSRQALAEALNELFLHIGSVEDAYDDEVAPRRTPRLERLVPALLGLFERSRTLDDAFRFAGGGGGQDSARDEAEMPDEEKPTQAGAVLLDCLYDFERRYRAVMDAHADDVDVDPYPLHEAADALLEAADAVAYYRALKAER